MTTEFSFCVEAIISVLPSIFWEVVIARIVRTGTHSLRWLTAGIVHSMHSLRWRLTVVTSRVGLWEVAQNEHHPPDSHSHVHTGLMPRLCVPPVGSGDKTTYTRGAYRYVHGEIPSSSKTGMGRFAGCEVVCWGLHLSVYCWKLNKLYSL